MVLGFKEQFVKPILSGDKIHTIRADQFDRWYAGRNIHFATGVRTKDYNCFKEGECVGVQNIRIGWLEVLPGNLKLLLLLITVI